MAACTEILTRLPDATPGAEDGLVICGTNAPIKFYGDGVAAFVLEGVNYGNNALLITGGDADTTAVQIVSSANTAIGIYGHDKALKLYNGVGTATPIQADLTGAVGIARGVSITWPFWLMDSSDHVTPIDEMVVTAIRSIDGGAFDTCTNAVAEISDGGYKILLDGETDLAGDTILLKFTATGADPLCFTIKTSS